MDVTPTASRLLTRRIEAISDSSAVIDRVVVGANLVLVQTGPDTAGVAVHAGGQVPAVENVSAIEVAKRGAETDALGPRAVGLAALNAIDPPERVVPGLDPFRRLDPAVERVAMVGLFGPVLDRLDAAHVDVFERDPATIAIPEDKTEGLEVALQPPEAASDRLPEAEVVYVTGSTLVWGGIETYLQAARPGQTIVLVGASASFTPDPLFEAGVSMVAGASVEDPATASRAIGDRQCETDLHDGGVSKWAAVDPDRSELPGLDLD